MDPLTPPPFPETSDLFYQIALRWTPRIIVGVVAGYYSLGIAYDYGIMSEIDRIAIRILRHHVGYIGLGAVMPTFQWYAAWGVRTAAALSAGILYDITERILLMMINHFRTKPVVLPLYAAPASRSPVVLEDPQLEPIPV